MSDESENIFDFLGIDNTQTGDKSKEVQKENLEKAKERFLDNLKTLKEMSVEELTLYKKWKSLKEQDAPTDMFRETFIEEMWKPSDILNEEKTVKEIESLSPIVEYVEDKELAYNGSSEYKNLYPFSNFDAYNWQKVRDFVHSAEHSTGPGRSLKFVVKNLEDKRILGIFMLSSDVVAIKGRDDFIGWNQDHKMHKGMLRCTAIGSTISPVQPFGYNFLGGKLVACMCLSQTPRKIWKERFGDTLCGITTTSIFGVNKGTMSQYTGIPYWNSLGMTSGKMSINPDDEVLKPMVSWFKENYPDEYDKLNNDSNPKQKVIKAIYKKIGIKSDAFDNESPRGCYFAPLYHNTPQFLRTEIGEKDLIPKPFADDNSVYENTSYPANKYMIDWWKKKSISRYCKLLENKQISQDVLFYGDMIGMTFEESKSRYLKDLGR